MLLQLLSSAVGLRTAFSKLGEALLSAFGCGFPRKPFHHHNVVVPSNPKQGPKSHQHCTPQSWNLLWAPDLVAVGVSWCSAGPALSKTDGRKWFLDFARLALFLLLPHSPRSFLILILVLKQRKKVLFCHCLLLNEK